MMKGANRKTPLFAVSGITGSLSANLMKVREALQKAPGTDDVRTAAQLHGRPDLAVRQNDVGHIDQQHHRDQHALDDREQNGASAR